MDSSRRVVYAASNDRGGDDLSCRLSPSPYTRLLREGDAQNLIWLLYNSSRSFSEHSHRLLFDVNCAYNTVLLRATSALDTMLLNASHKAHRPTSLTLIQCLYNVYNILKKFNRCLIWSLPNKRCNPCVNIKIYSHRAFRVVGVHVFLLLILVAVLILLAISNTDAVSSNNTITKKCRNVIFLELTLYFLSRRGTPINSLAVTGQRTHCASHSTRFIRRVFEGVLVRACVA